MLGGVALFIWSDKQVTDLKQRQSELVRRRAVLQAELKMIKEDSDFLAVLQRAMVVGDIGTLRAALLVPAALFALTDELRTLVVDAYAAATDPEGHTAVGELTRGVALVERAGQAFVAHVTRLIPFTLGTSALCSRHTEQTREGKLRACHT